MLRAITVAGAVVLCALLGAGAGALVGHVIGLYHATDDRLADALSCLFAQLSALIAGGCGGIVGAIAGAAGALAACRPRR
jgi:hypothetical protein